MRTLTLITCAVLATISVAPAFATAAGDVVIIAGLASHHWGLDPVVCSGSGPFIAVADLAAGAAEVTGSTKCGFAPQAFPPGSCHADSHAWRCSFTHEGISASLSIPTQGSSFVFSRGLTLITETVAGGLLRA